MHEHLAALHRALTVEQRAEGLEHERLGALPDEEQIAAGFAWPPMVAMAVERAGRRYRVTLQASKGVVLHDGIGPGAPVWVDGQDGTCVGVEEGHAEVMLFRRVDEGRPLRVTQRHDPTTFVRFRQALERADETPSPLRDVLLGASPNADAEARPDADAVALAQLDEAQRHAARHALDADTLAVIHGPPGTGKTRMLAAVLDALVTRGERAWALADSNAAVDHLALQASERGLEVLRLGHTARIGSAAAPLSLEARIASGHLGPALVALDREIARTDGYALRQLLDERRRLRDQARRLVVEGADVIAATFGTLARLAPELPAVATAVVDEATQATEPAVWVAVPFVQRLVLVGDPHQLGPVSKADSGLERSLLQRLVEEARVPLPMLEIQYRMATPIRELVAPVYGANYVDHDIAAARRLDDLPPTTWVDTAGADLREAIDPTTRSLYNEGEAALVAVAVGDLRARGVSPDRIGVITPYSAQVACLKRQAALAGIEVATVNAFQGREKDAIAVSWVRSNEQGELGFVTDGRRLTVALTRARCWLWLVGDAATLACHPRFAAIVEHHEKIDALQSAWDPPWSEVLRDLT
jgi:ATP-dependent RNA/DNA helicase IGHMBP2